ncbi:MAG: hypothetical protein PHP61_04515 [Candidatus Izemoplasmatales bacterium]|jgi:uncharacterized membrane protein YtjA (UPF0391 family)|nr:hypothetical protein [Candidatus Izemoplasmatales bacterium]NLF48900.1 hypothetical protein [Acholeplasmataceae bacterium]MDD4355146.1 hypothetical protein [Candidatus Izemoplasmatales bacterium]MDD4987400.1 hypothetical protein [Candidatus Izemoplasmatales bacterium]MDD5601782.1 hypothetical protein [Candidatus Izemoplasmatales bacterium]
MKRLLIDVLIGLAVGMGVWLMQKAMLAFLSVGVDSHADHWFKLYNIAFLVAGIIAGCFGFILGIFEKINPAKAGMISGFIWAIMTFLVFLVIGLINRSTNTVFSAYGFYVAIGLTFIGPLLYSWGLKGRGHK